MKRSEINAILDASASFIRSFGFTLPPFAQFTPAQMMADEQAPLRARAMGWDITDYGRGGFAQLGLVLFTLRNGVLGPAGDGMQYAEKIMISRKDQISPMHRHNIKVEDIINRGGAPLVLELFAADQNGGIDRSRDVVVAVDGTPRSLPAGGHLRLMPGQSVTLHPTVWHAFWSNGGDVLIGEVSTVNDDNTDNVFEMDIGRFSTVQEDVPPQHLLVSDYESFAG